MTLTQPSAKFPTVLPVEADLKTGPVLQTCKLSETSHFRKPKGSICMVIIGMIGTPAGVGFYGSE
jgi:hypothetical protein